MFFVYYVEFELSLRIGKKTGGAGNSIYLSSRFISNRVCIQLTKNEGSYMGRYLLIIPFSQDAEMT